MSAHEAFAQSFRRGIFSDALPQGVTARDPAEADQRFAVYRNNVLHSLGRALAARFPVIERLVGADFFNAMARVYAEADPPNSPMLFAWGAGSPNFWRVSRRLRRCPICPMSRGSNMRGGRPITRPICLR